MDNSSDNQETENEESENEEEKLRHKRKSSTNESIGKTAKRSRTDDGSEEEKRIEERRAANRRSALKSRQKRKMLIEELQKKVKTLSKEADELRKANCEMKSQLEVARHENEMFRQTSSVGQSTETVAVPHAGNSCASSTLSNPPYKANDPFSAATTASSSTVLPNESLVMPGELPAFRQIVSQRISSQANRQPAATQNHSNIPSQSLGLLLQLAASNLSSIGSNPTRFTRQRMSLGDNQLQPEMALIQAMLASQVGTTENQTSGQMSSA